MNYKEIAFLAVQIIIALTVIGLTAYMMIRGLPIPELLVGGWGAVIGYFVRAIAVSDTVQTALK